MLSFGVIFSKKNIDQGLDQSHGMVIPGSPVLAQSPQKSVNIGHHHSVFVHQYVRRVSYLCCDVILKQVPQFTKAIRYPLR